VIGRNGAGKSTLLKILSRITEPTTGEGEIHGRIGSLLEVGTGFHSELTGRENIYLSGAILGMRREETTARFDQIVDFSGVERFIDTPVKHYSSGMYLRLAFSVAAHLEPDILLVDEVLAVGDAEFQKKCLGKMGAVARSGRTVVFVSHNLPAVESLCERAIWIEDGRVARDGPVRPVIAAYLGSTALAHTERRWANTGAEEVIVHRASVRPENGLPAEPIDVNTPFVIEVVYESATAGARVHPSIHLQNDQSVTVFSTAPGPQGVVTVGPTRATCHVPGNLLNDGLHSVSFFFMCDERVVRVEPEALVFEMLDATAGRDGWYGQWPGVVRPALDWSVEPDG
jgi:lipopolysaccharide transport system ATP-binding protein